jgi:FAD/FMN-containing dehydrogenase
LTDGKLYKIRQAKWRTICRELAGRDDDRPGHLMLSSTEIMIAITRHATKLPELTALVPLVPRPYKVKNRQALYNSPAAIVRPLDISQVQSCVRLALANKPSLAILGGGHSDHCLWPNVVSVEMGAFDKVYVVNTPQNADTDCWVVAEAGCQTGDIIKETMPAGVTVTLGSRPSVGAGFWLQGGIGHLARHYGLACDAIVGAVMVDAISGQVLCIGHIPEHNIDHRMPFATNMMRNYCGL